MSSDAPTADARSHPLLSPGDRLTTVAGRTIVFPPATGRLAARLRAVDAWLVHEGRQEALYRRESHMAVLIGGVTDHGVVRGGMNPAALSPVDRDILNEYLFGDAAGPVPRQIRPAPVPRRPRSRASR